MKNWCAWNVSKLEDAGINWKNITLLSTIISYWYHCTKLWICLRSLKKWVPNPSIPLNRFLSNRWCALARVTTRDLSHTLLVQITYYLQVTHPCLPLMLDDTPFSEHTLLPHLWLSLPSWYHPSEALGHTLSRPSSGILSSEALVTPPRASWACFPRALILHYLSPWLGCELLENRDCISDLCIPIISRDRQQMLTVQMRKPQGFLKHARFHAVTTLPPAHSVLANSVSFLLAAQARNPSSHLNFKINLDQSDHCHHPRWLQSHTVSFHAL